jgi:hypothetical protein
MRRDVHRKLEDATDQLQKIKGAAAANPTNNNQRSTHENHPLLLLA